MIFDARQLACGWLAVAVASAKDDGYPVLNRTVLIELFAEGVRLVATDSVMLLHAWVPDVEHDLDPGPGLDEAPIRTAVAYDPHSRGQSLLSHALKLAAEADRDGTSPVQIRLGLDGTLAEARGQQQLAGIETRYVTLEIPGDEQERKTLRSVDGEFPSWRGLLDDFEGELTTQLALAPDVLGQLARLRTWHPRARVGMEFGGDGRPVLLTALESDPHIAGIVMPCRWDLQRNRPRVDGMIAEVEAFLRDAVGDYPDRVDADLVAAATALVVTSQLASAAMLQRKLRVPYARALWLIEQLEKRGVIGPDNGTEGRDVLMTREELDELVDDQDDEPEDGGDGG